MIGERFPSASTFAIPYSSRQSSSVSAPGDAPHQQRVAVENSSALKALCIRTRRSLKPLHSTAHCQFSSPLPCLVSPSLVPINKKKSSKNGRANLLHTRALFLDVLDTTILQEIRKTCNVPQSLRLIQIRRTSTAMLARHT